MSIKKVWALLTTWTTFFQLGLVITSIIKYGIKLLIHSRTSMVQPLKFGDEIVISAIFWVCDYLSRLRLIQVSKRGPWGQKKTWRGVTAEPVVHRCWTSRIVIGKLINGLWHSIPERRTSTNYLYRLLLGAVIPGCQLDETRVFSDDHKHHHMCGTCSVPFNIYTFQTQYQHRRGLLPLERKRPYIYNKHTN